MTAAIMFGLLVWLATFLALVAAREHRARRQGDAAWQPTGTRLTTEAGYDEQKAMAGVRQSRRQTSRGTPLRRRSRKVVLNDEKVTTFRKKA